MCGIAHIYFQENIFFSAVINMHTYQVIVLKMLMTNIMSTPDNVVCLRRSDFALRELFG